MNVVFAPDYSRDNPYQTLLARSLKDEDVNVEFFRNYRRVLPLARGLRTSAYDLIHIHWPEAYVRQRGDIFDWFRIARLPMDIGLALRGRPLVVTAHNLHPHAIPLRKVKSSFRTFYKMAKLIIAHSSAAAEAVAATYGVDARRITVIPHGDLAEELDVLPTYEEMQNAVDLPRKPYVLIFGGMQPYKGIEEILKWWDEGKPELYIVGSDGDSAYQKKIMSEARLLPNVILRLGRLDPDALARWIVGAQAVVLNHVAALTSGAAALVRSLDAPLLLPNRLLTVDLDEPHPRVFRFEGREEFDLRLKEAISSSRTPLLSHHWRQATSWKTVGRQTAEAYRRVLGKEL